jgi:DNA-binding NarL/FixJ family response regulator
MPLTILVVDDDLGTRLSISDYLEISGYLVTAAENGQKALEMLEKFQPHLLITDITMPFMDGYELVRQVRCQPVFRLLPVIFLTARTHTKERVRGYQLGCDIFLPKPFELEELRAVIRNLLERSQMIESEWRFRMQTTGGTKAAERSPEPTSLPAATTNRSEAITFNLTPREQDVLTLLSDGLPNAQIGDRLHLSSRTVEKYVSSLLRKTDTSNRAELVRFAMEHHLVE